MSQHTPTPGDDIDPVGQMLRDLDRVCTGLEFTNPIRLYGDRTIISRALDALAVTLSRIDEQPPHSEAAE